MTKADDTLAGLREGNLRFVAGAEGNEIATDASQSYRLMLTHAPTAIVVGCSDARVPAEIIFGQNIGSLFVIRVAGNVVTPTQIGSVEFAAEQFNVPLVVVLGHSNCGAVQATLQSLRQDADSISPNLRTIVDCIRPGIEPLLDADPPVDDEELLERAIRANVRTSVERLRSGSATLRKLEAQGKLVIVGAEYILDSGRVEFLDLD